VAAVRSAMTRGVPGPGDYEETVRQDEAAHRIRTPLTVLLGYAELLADGSLGPLSDVQERAVQAMVTAALQLMTCLDEPPFCTGEATTPGE